MIAVYKYIGTFLQFTLFIKLDVAISNSYYVMCWKINTFIVWFRV